MTNSYECNAYIIDEIDGVLNYTSDETSVLIIKTTYSGILTSKKIYRTLGELDLFTLGELDPLTLLEMDEDI